MAKALAVLGSLLALTILYLLLWPVPVDPVAWDAPANLGLVDPYEQNEQLEAARGIDLGEHHGPEDVTAGHDNHLYATTTGGAILQIDSRGNVDVFADAGGRPLGIETDADGSLLVANAYVGLQRIFQDGSVVTLLDEVNGQPLVYADDVAVGNDGTVYFSEASTKFGAAEFDGTYEGSLLDIMEHGGHGQVIEFRPITGEARVIIDGLNFANGVAISDDQQYLLIAETGSYRILKYWLQGPDAGNTEVLIDNLPAFPDNINNGMNGRFWIGMVAPRNELLDKLSDKPFLRKVTQRLPASVRPKAEPYAHVIAINGDGEVLMNMHDPAARFSTLTGVLETSDALYLTTLFGHTLPRLDKDDF
ncbi:MAG: SMP-30/gluconolactonase/LRE family protein [Gammaproteobacteria bacterium]|nr:SMP-30/gluconolactonase/LRE family protein [Gammaproteobacteria bacterium]MDH3372586.1 SMP-30/gluconolactonase/LRE family protein [Gammaproteobacteria bacterium]MDH3408757.1 SMP-30/gluconolactonase/LRE family protein [Gammaproteobacteria bacterium]